MRKLFVMQAAVRTVIQLFHIWESCEAMSMNLLLIAMSVVLLD